MILPKPGDIFLKEWTKSDKKPKLWCIWRNLCHCKKVLTGLFYIWGLGSLTVNTNRKYLLTQAENISFPHIFPLSDLSRVYFPNNRSCRSLKIVQNACEFTIKWFYIVSQTFFMNLTMENPPWITVRFRLLLRNKLCTWHENKRPETFSVGQLSGRFGKGVLPVHQSIREPVHLESSQAFKIM